MNRCEAVAERRNRREMMKITAHEASEKMSRIARTDFPTHPVCKKAVHSCTKARVAWGHGVAAATCLVRSRK